jgi:Protein of unknown function (DUF3107)
VEVKIGIQSAPRELVLETDSEPEDVEAALKAALADGGILTLTNAKGGQVLLPADKIAYIEFGSIGPRRVGFSNG